MKLLMTFSRLFTDVRQFWLKSHNDNRFASNILLTSVTNAIQALLGLITGVLVARLLGPEGRGILAAIQMWPSVIATLAMLGLSESLVYFSAKNPKQTGAYLSTAIVITMAMALPFMTISYLIMPYILGEKPTIVIEGAQWYLFLIPVYSLVGLPIQALRGLQDFVRWNALRLLPTVAWLILLCIALIFGVRQAEILANAYLVFQALLFIPVITIVLSRIYGPYIPQKNLVKPLLRFGFPTILSSIPQFLNQKLDQMVVAAFLPTSSLGLYVVAVSWGNIVIPLASAIGSSVFPKIASQSDSIEQQLFLARSTRIAFLVCFIIGLFLFFFTPWALPLIFGPNFEGAIIPATILIIGGVITGVNQVLGEGLKGMGRPSLVLWSELMGLLITAPIMFILLPKFGIIGASVSSMISAIITLIVMLFVAKRNSNISIFKYIVPTISDVKECYLKIKVLL